MEQKEIYTERAILEFKSLSSIFDEIQSSMGGDRQLRTWFLLYGPTDDQLLDEEILLDQVLPIMIEKIKTNWPFSTPHILVQKLVNAYNIAKSNRDDYLKSVLPINEGKLTSVVNVLPSQKAALEAAKKLRNIERGGVGYVEQVGPFDVAHVNGAKIHQIDGLIKQNQGIQKGFERRQRLEGVLQRVRSAVKNLNEKIDLSSIRIAIYPQKRTNGLSNTLANYGAEKVSILQDLDRELVPGDFDVVVVVNGDNGQINPNKVSRNYSVEIIRHTGNVEATARAIIERLDEVRKIKEMARQMNVVH